MTQAPMSHRSDEELFRAFQQQRDCDALGILFRRRAQDLVRLAVFVAPSPSDAEDLVQATFLAAITRAETFHDGGLVMSWLSGILTNQARMLHRAARRRSPEPDSGRAAGEPVTTALQAELRAALTACIASLPEPYHSVLTLHLHNGLDSQEISRRLARPAATVRKQMERAIDRLRQALPIGLATGVALRFSPDVLAQNAANAARYGEIEAAQSATPTPPMVRVGWQGLRLLGSAALALVLALGGLTAWWSWSAASHVPAHQSLLVTTASAPAAVSELPLDPPGLSATTDIERDHAMPTGVLTVRAHTSDGTVQSGVELLVVPFSEQSLAERLLFHGSQSAVTDARGAAAFPALAPGCYQVLVPGGVPQTRVQVAGTDVAAQIVVAPPLRMRGKVVDHLGMPVADAEVVASASAGRGGPGAVVARTGSDGLFAATVHLSSSGRVWARHGSFGPSVGVRLEADRDLRLELAASTRSVTVTTVDVTGQPLANCFVGLVPRSEINQQLLAQHGCTDAAGRCTFSDPGPGEATVVATRPDRAARMVELPSDGQIVVTLETGGAIAGVALAADGQPLAGCEVQVVVPGLRTNEPAGALVSRLLLTDAAGAFTCSQLPVGNVQLRIQAPSMQGLLVAGPVVASTEVAVRAGERTDAGLRVRRGPILTGRVATADHQGMAGWLVIATPDAGIAQLRQSRQRTAYTNGDGKFVIGGINAADAYQVGVFPPESLQSGVMPHAVSRVEAGVTAVGEMVVSPGTQPTARLRCRITDAAARPLAGASLELRPLMFQIASTKTSGADGRCEFEGLRPGQYWLARMIAGSGSRTMAVTIGADGDVADLGDLVFEPPAFVTVAVRGAPHRIVRVVARHDIGDRYIEAMADAAGIAKLPAMTPGPVRLLVHGPGMMPETRTMTLVSGPQDVLVEARSAGRLLVSLDFSPADNPLPINGPLQVQLFDAVGQLVLEDYVGSAAAPGMFRFVTGLPAGDYRLHARSIWNASAITAFQVAESGVSRVSAPLRL